MAGTTTEPKSVALVRDFLNTVEFDEGWPEASSDEISTPEELGDWLAGHDLAPPDLHLDDRDLDLAVELRAALRALLWAKWGEGDERSAVAELNRVASELELVIEFHGDETSSLVPRDRSARGALAQLLAEVYRSMTDGSWARLKVCHKHSCRWAFYDTSRNRSRNWCSMRVCGNQVKVARYRERQADEG